jgi:hypothetical protein
MYTMSVRCDVPALLALAVMCIASLSLTPCDAYVDSLIADMVRVMPGEVWRPSSPVAVAHSAQFLYVAATTTTGQVLGPGDASTVLKMDDSGCCVLNITIPDSNILQLTASATSPFVLSQHQHTAPSRPSHLAAGREHPQPPDRRRTAIP